MKGSIMVQQTATSQQPRQVVEMMATAGVGNNDPGGEIT